MRFSIPCFVSVVIALLLWQKSVEAQSLPQAGQNLLDWVLESHSATRDSIQTFSCRIDVKLAQSHGENWKVTSAHGWYRRTPEIIRITSTEGSRTTDCVIEQSVVKISSRIREANDKRLETAQIRAFTDNKIPSECNAWYHGLMTGILPNTISAISFNELVKQSSRFVSAKWIGDGTERLVQIELKFNPSYGMPDEWNVQIDFDPKVNYLVRRMVAKTTATSPAKFRREWEVIQYKEIIPGCYFPEQSIGRVFDHQGNLLMTTESKFTDVRINQPIPPESLAITFSHGITLVDSIRKVEYQVDSKGNRISPETPWRFLPPPPPASRDDDGSNRKIGLPSEDEVEPSGSWIVLISLLLIAIGIIIHIINRRRMMS